jgi:hypothetical protein
MQTVSNCFYAANFGSQPFTTAPTERIFSPHFVKRCALSGFHSQFGGLGDYRCPSAPFPLTAVEI